MGGVVGRDDGRGWDDVMGYGMVIRDTGWCDVVKWREGEGLTPHYFHFFLLITIYAQQPLYQIFRSHSS